jgi:hypothetical protein
MLHIKDMTCYRGNQKKKIILKCFFFIFEHTLFIY